MKEQLERAKESAWRKFVERENQIKTNEDEEESLANKAKKINDQVRRANE